MTAEFFGEGLPFHPAIAAEPSAILARPLLSKDDKAALDPFLKCRPSRPVDSVQKYQAHREYQTQFLELFSAALDDPFGGHLHIVSTDFEYLKVQLDYPEYTWLVVRKT